MLISSPLFSATIARPTVPAEHAAPTAPSSVSIPVKGLHSTNGVIVILYPGYHGDIDGYARKYEKLALYLQQYVGASLRAGNTEHPHLHYTRSMVNDLRAVIQYALENSKTICGSADPRLFLMGFSAGGSCVAALAHEFKEVEAILLLAPSMDAGLKPVRTGLASYASNVFIAVGEQDEVVGKDTAEMIYGMVTAARHRQLFIVPECDHQFKGAINGRILSSAPRWAFTREMAVPDAAKGIWLYD